VSYGHTNITVRCHEIRAGSVVVDIEWLSGKRELFLGTNGPQGQHPG
jgi:hypothetical protein